MFFTTVGAIMLGAGIISENPITAGIGFIFLIIGFVKQRGKNGE